MKATPNAKVAQIEDSLNDMSKIVDPITTKSRLEAYCAEVRDSMATKNFTATEKATIESALAENDAGSATTKDDLERKFKALGDAVNPIMVAMNKRAGAVSGQIVHLKDGGCYFEADEPPTKAKLLLEDSTGVVFIDLDECADDNSLAAIADHLQHCVRRNMVNRAIVLTIQAEPKHPAMHRHLMRSGAFMLGLRTLCLPILGVINGHISGPAWGLALCCDYRIGVLGAKFQLPMCHAPQCLNGLVGPVIATEMCTSTSTLDANAMLELGVLQEARPTFEEAKMSAYEMGKRIGRFPIFGLRQVMNLLTPDPETFANAVAEDPSIMAQVYEDDVVQ